MTLDQYWSTLVSLKSHKEANPRQPRGPQKISTIVGNLLVASTSLNSPLYVRPLKPTNNLGNRLSLLILSTNSQDRKDTYRVNSPGSAGRRSGMLARAEITARMTAGPPWTCSSQVSSPVKLASKISHSLTQKIIFPLHAFGMSKHVSKIAQAEKRTWDHLIFAIQDIYHNLWFIYLAGPGNQSARAWSSWSPVLWSTSFRKTAFLGSGNSCRLKILPCLKSKHHYVDMTLRILIKWPGFEPLNGIMEKAIKKPAKFLNISWPSLEKLSNC